MLACQYPINVVTSAVRLPLASNRVRIGTHVLLTE
ncbi:hypothetical protein YPPY19_1290, partial [Yersinia pestis PY-19]